MSRSRRCPEYSHVWAGDQRQKLFCNLEAFGGNVLISAVTAPGSGEMPWDESVCAGLGEHKHSGQFGCRVEHAVAGRWNRAAQAGWRRLHRRAYQETIRRLARAYLDRLAELAPGYGFGFVDSRRDCVKAMPAQNAAAYLSSYFVREAEERRRSGSEPCAVAANMRLACLPARTGQRGI